MSIEWTETQLNEYYRRRANSHFPSRNDIEWLTEQGVYLVPKRENK